MTVAVGKLKPLLRKAKREGWAKWVRSPADERAVLNGCTFDKKVGERPIDFMQRFVKHSKGEWVGQPFVPLQWQREDMLMPLFGWQRKNGTRRYQRAYIEVPKKNGKSFSATAVGAYMLVGDGEAGAEVYSVACDKEQASIVFNEMRSMVMASSELAAVLHPNETLRRITYHKTASWFRALSSEHATKEGLNIHCLIFDELHAQTDRRLWDALVYGGAARRQPLVFVITTAGFDRESICYEQHEYAQRILDGTIENDAYFAYIRAAAPDADWTDRKVWEACNPSWGVTVKIDQFEEDCKAAQQSPASQNTFRRRRLNQWTEQYERAIPMDKWDACVGDMDPEELKGQPCWCGLDLSATSDLTAFVMVFRKDDRYKVIGRYWVPEAMVAKRLRKGKPEYANWVRDGHLLTTPGDLIDYGFVREEINVLAKDYRIQQIAIDRLFQGAQFEMQLREEDGFESFPFGQGYKDMAVPTLEFERAVLSGRLEHGGDPVLRWAVSNLQFKMGPAGIEKPDKDHSGDKIDPVVSLIMGLGRAMMQPPKKKRYYEENAVYAV